MFSLQYREDDTVRSFALPEGQTILGRSPECSLCLDHQGISRKHAAFTVSKGRCFVHDLGSSNGTYLNGQLVGGAETEVADGDKVLVGWVWLRVVDSVGEAVILADDTVSIVSETTRRTIPASPGHAPLPVKASVSAERLLELLSDIGRTLVNVDSVSNIGDKVTEVVLAAVPAERCVFFLRDEAADALVPRAVRHRNGSTTAPVAISRTVLSRVTADRVAMLAADAQVDRRLGTAESLVMQSVRSLICAPLWNRDKMIGVLYADAPDVNQFSEADLDLFTALSNYAAAAVDRATLTAEIEEEKRRRARLERYHSPAVVERILDAGGEEGFIAQEREVSVLFADLVGFTPWSEGLSPNAVAQRLNRCLACMSDAIFEEEGMLDKFLGDAAIGVFGAPIDQPDHRERAVRAALSIRRGLATLKQEPSEPPMQVRIAINSGTVMVGDIGSPGRRDYTVLGDIVNTTSRIQSEVAKPGQILITRSTRDQLRAKVKLKELGSVNVRGRTGAVEVFEVTGFR